MACLEAKSVAHLLSVADRLAGQVLESQADDAGGKRMQASSSSARAVLHVVCCRAWHLRRKQEHREGRAKWLQ